MLFFFLCVCVCFTIEFWLISKLGVASCYDDWRLEVYNLSWIWLNFANWFLDWAYTLYMPFFCIVGYGISLSRKLKLSRISATKSMRCLYIVVTRSILIVPFSYWVLRYWHTGFQWVTIVRFKTELLRMFHSRIYLLLFLPVRSSYFVHVIFLCHYVNPKIHHMVRNQLITSV